MYAAELMTALSTLLEAPDSKLLKLVRRVQAALKTLLTVKPPIEFDGSRFVIPVPEEADKDHVVRAVADALPGSWENTRELSGEEYVAVYTPGERVGAPYVFVDFAPMMVVFGQYTTADLTEGVVCMYRQKARSELGSLVTEMRSILEADDEIVTVQGKKGVWRTTDAGSHIFLPSDGSSPIISKDPAVNAKLAGSSKAGGSKASSDPVLSEPTTKSNWKDKFKAAAKKLGHVAASPFLMVKELVQSKETRKRAKDHIANAVKKEVAGTKQLMGTLGKALKGGKITDDEREQVVNQTIDLVKAGLLVASVGHVFAEGPVKAIMALMTPADEMVGMAIDSPLQAATTKIFGKKYKHGILPSAFYEGPRVFHTVEGKNETPEQLMAKIVDAILAEMAAAEVE